MTEVPKLYEGIFERAEKSRASAIKANCLQCVGFTRKDVTECSDRTCPLWTWRPYQPKEDSDAT